MTPLFKAVHTRYVQESKPARLKTRRRRHRVIALCICMLCGMGLVGGLGAVSHLEKFAINNVSVSGAKQISSESIITAVKTALRENGFHLFSKRNMFLYPKSTIESDLAADFPRIQQVSVGRSSLLASAVVVTVKERAAYATWCDTHEKCYALDYTGFIYAESGDSPKTAYVFRGGLLPSTDVIGQTFLRGRLAGIITILNALKSAGFTPKGLSVDSEKDFSIPLENGPRILASFDMQPTDIVHNLQTALEADGVKTKFGALQYIDLRFGNRVYYK